MFCITSWGHLHSFLLTPANIARATIFFLSFKRFIYLLYVSTLQLSSYTPEEGARVVVSHHVVAGIWTQDLQESSQCLTRWAVPPAPLSLFLFHFSSIAVFVCSSDDCQGQGELGWGCLIMGSTFLRGGDVGWVMDSVEFDRDYVFFFKSY